MFPDIRSQLLSIVWIYLTYCIHSSISDQDDLFENPDWERKCEPITTPFCQRLEYQKTALPNLLHHQTQHDAGQAVMLYFPALKAQCSPDIQLFLCSVYIPICTQMPKPLPPCRSLCESVKTGCEKLLSSFALKWPENLNCDKFPDENDTGLCVSKNKNGTTSQESSNDQGSGGSGRPMVDTAGPFMSPGKEYPFTCPEQFRVPKGYDDSLKVGQVVATSCGLPCDNMFFTKEERRFSRFWIGTWSVVCAISCLFTVLTFMLNTSRFRYPERPIIFLSICYLVVSVIYICGFISGDKVACRRPFPAPVDKPQLQTVSTIAQGTKGELCTIMFIGLYFFTMASSLWWVILALTWFLAAGLKWGHEAIEANSQYFHLAAWAIPAIKTISILALGRIEGDILTGVCYVGLWDADIGRAFVLAPLSIYLVFGTIFLMLGFISLFHIRTAMKHDGTKTDKLEKLMLRIGIFSLLYTVPAVTVIVCLIYEQMNFDHWMVTWHGHICHASNNNPYLIRCPSGGLNKKPNFYIYMLKYLSSLIVGITSCVWIASHKTVASWKELFYRMRGKQGQTYV